MKLHLSLVVLYIVCITNSITCMEKPKAYSLGKLISQQQSKKQFNPLAQYYNSLTENLLAKIPLNEEDRNNILRYFPRA